MIPKLHQLGSGTAGLLRYLYGRGTKEEHTDPHLVAAFDPLTPDPGRDPGDPDATHRRLQHLLDQPVNAMTAGHRPGKHVWHLSVRAAPEDPILTDEDWAVIARRVVAAAGIAPTGDDAACRWAAVRHADDHIHIIATLVREDGRRPRRHKEAKRVQAECRRIEADYQLRRLNAGDGTAAKRPTSAERHKADRQDKQVTSRERLRATVRTIAAHAHSETEFFETLAGSGVLVDKRLAPSGDTLGYKVALADDVNAQGEPVWFAGGTLAMDLTWPKIRQRLTSTDASEDQQTRSLRPAERWRHTTQTVHTAHTTVVSGDPAAAQAQLAAVGDLLYILPTLTTGPTRSETFAAAQAFERATCSRIRFEYAQAAALRASAKRLLHTAGQPIGTAPAADLLLTLLDLAIAAHRFHQAHHHIQQAAAAQAALAHLRTAYRHTAAPTLAQLAAHAPPSDRQRGYADLVRLVLPEHAERILADPAWPVLAATLATTEAAGTPLAGTLADTAGQRELNTAAHPAETLLWRLQNTPNKRVEAALTRTSTSTSTSTQPTRAHRSTAPHSAATSAPQRPEGPRRPR